MTPAVYGFLLLTFIALDQLTKFGAVSQVLNTGISFSLLANSDFLPLILSLVAGIAWFFSLRPAQEHHLLLAHALFFSGAFSNSIDRWFFGGVRDIWWLPILNVHNNLADWYIALAVFWVLTSQIWLQRVQYRHDE